MLFLKNLTQQHCGMSMVLMWRSYLLCDFPCADIHKLISSDLLHQAIKETFKDHLVDWVGLYLEITHEKAEADWIMDEIDQRYIHFLSTFIFFYFWVHDLGLQLCQHFPSYANSSMAITLNKQWTGDNSKALMKVCIHIMTYVQLFSLTS